MTPMPHQEKPNNRNLIGIFVLIFGLGAYAFLVAALGEWIAAFGQMWQIPFYAVAGIIWIFPARALIRWMALGRKHDT